MGFLTLFLQLFSKCVIISRSSLVAQMVKNPPAMRETWLQSLGQEDPLEKGMATHSSILAWKILWTEIKSLKSYSYYQHMYV